MNRFRSYLFKLRIITSRHLGSRHTLTEEKDDDDDESHACSGGAAAWQCV